MASKYRTSERLNWEDVRDSLRSWREDNVRRSEDVVALWDSILRTDIDKLNDEKWSVYEQVCMAAYDCHRMDVAKVCLAKLQSQFPDSVRVNILTAMKFEVKEKFNEAIKQYELILKEDKANLAAHKRKIAILKAQGRIQEAIRELTEYLKKFMSDQEGWLELSDLYIQEQEYTKAAFCMEEVILFNPHNHLYYQRYAEIRYTQGGLENMECARAYFSKAIKINPNNIRALYGFFLAASNIYSSPKCTAQKKKENQKYANWATKQILEQSQVYQNGNEDVHLKVIENMLSSLQLSSH